ncbi:LLM class flavin-dependent oxidoreductase [Gordonia sp. NPDC003950]
MTISTLDSAIDANAERASAFRLGFFTQVHGTDGRGATETYSELTDTIIAAEELGYESVWVGQHHFGKDRLASPLVLFAALAQRTTRIELGTAVTVLPLEDPIRLAEDAATLHALAGDRINLGLGAGGGDAESFGAFGHGLEERRRLFDEKLATLHALLDGASITGPAEPRVLYPPAPGLRERLWHSVGTPERAAAAARAGDGLLIGTFADHALHDQRPKIDAYRTQWAHTHADSGRRQRIGALRFTYVAESRETIERQVENELNAFREFADSYKPDLAPLDTAQYLRRVTRYGTVADVIGDLRDDPALVGQVTHFLPTVGLYPAAGNGTPGADLDIHRLQLFAEEIAPALGWVPPNRR